MADACPDTPPQAGAGPGDTRPGLRRWVDDLAMGARFAVAGGPEGWFRTLLTAVGVGLGVAVLLLAAAVPSMIDARSSRDAQRGHYGMGEAHSPDDDTLLYAEADTEYHEEEIWGRLLQPDGDSPPLPAGIEHIPAPGEMLVSPALQDLLDSDEGALLNERLPHEIIGTIGDDGLIGPSELAYYAGSDELVVDRGASRIDGYGKVGDGGGLNVLLLLLVVVACVVLLLPVGAFIATAVRLSGEQRDKRLAALRLVGADIRMTHRIAAGEALVGALFGLVVGAVLFLAGRQLLAGFELSGYSFFPSDVKPLPLITVLVLVAVPVAAVAVTLQSLRRISIEPLGVVRGAALPSRRLWWRLLPSAVGLLLLLPLSGDIRNAEGPLETWRISAGIVLLVVGIAALLPWLVEVAVRWLRGGPLPLQLATRRLQLDSGPAARAVSGITVAVAGAIAVQMLFSGAEGEFVENTGQDTKRAQVQIWDRGSAVEEMAEMTVRLEGARGVSKVLGTVTGSAMAPVEGDQEAVYHSLTVADCPTLVELAEVGDCVDGSVYVVPQPDQPGHDPIPGVSPGAQLNLALPHWETEELPEPVLWTVPEDAATVPSRVNPMGEAIGGVLATPSALDVSLLSSPSAEVLLRIDETEPEVMEYVRNTAVGVSPTVSVVMMESQRYDDDFEKVQAGLYLGAVGVMLLIGVSMVVSTLEQLRERRRLLSVLVAFGTRRSTLGWSVLWQTVLPVALGMALAVVGGVGLGAVLLIMISEPVTVYWPTVGAMAGLGAGIVLLATLLSLPPLWRMMRPDGLRTE